MYRLGAIPSENLDLGIRMSDGPVVAHLHSAPVLSAKQVLNTFAGALDREVLTVVPKRCRSMTRCLSIA